METQVQEQIAYLDSQRQLFDHDYEMRYPKPNNGTNKWVIGGLLAMLIAAVIVSASETVPFFMGRNNDLDPVFKIAVAISVIVMVEIAIVLTSHLIVRFTKRSVMPVIYLLFAALIIAMSVAVSANIVGQLERREIWVDENINTIVSILAASSAPFMALIAGVVFALLEKVGKHEIKEWQSKKNSAWTTHKNKYDIEITVSKPQTPTLPQGMEQTGNIKSSINSIPIGNNGMETGYGFQRNSSALDKALEHYKKHPEDLETNPIELGEKLGIGKSTMYKARSQARKNR